MPTRKKSLLRLKTLPSFSDGSNDRAIQNAILAGLPPKERDAVFAKLEFLELPKHLVLSEVGQRIEYGYFVHEGLVSILAVMSDGKSVEVGLVGKEGFVGLPLLANFQTSSTRVVLQVAGSGFRISTGDLRDVLRECPNLNRSIQRFSQIMTFQTMQIAACNRLHEVHHRLARWLLMSQDRIGGDAVPLTQETLSHMLGTRRASVTVAAGILHKQGLITYRRGDVRIDNRGELQGAACECYENMKRQADKWQSETASK